MSMDYICENFVVNKIISIVKVMRVLIKLMVSFFC